MAAASGAGEIGTAFVDGASALVRVAAKSPLKLTVARERGPCVRVHSATFGGGLLAGDAIDLTLDVGTRSSLSLGTSAPAKVYRCENGGQSTQRTLARIGSEAICAIAPAPVACFAGARYEQRIDIDLAVDGNLLLLDSFTSGRAALGERWVFDHYGARTCIRIADRLVLHEALVLDATSTPIAERFGRFDVCATVVIAGPRLQAALDAMAAAIAAQPASRDGSVFLACSRWPWGVVVRAAATATEPLEQALGTLLAPAFAVVGGGDAWHGPW